MATDLVAQIKGVKIDMTYMGFTVDPEVPAGLFRQQLRQLRQQLRQSLGGS